MEESRKRRPGGQTSQLKPEPIDNEHSISPAESTKKPRTNTTPASDTPNMNQRAQENKQTRSAAAPTTTLAPASAQSPFAQIAASASVASEAGSLFRGGSTHPPTERRAREEPFAPSPPHIFPTATTARQAGLPPHLSIPSPSNQPTTKPSSTPRATSFAAGSSAMVKTPTWPSALSSNTNTEVTETQERLAKLEAEMAEFSRRVLSLDDSARVSGDRVGHLEEKTVGLEETVKGVREEARRAGEQQTELRSIVERQAQEIRELRAEKMLFETSSCVLLGATISRLSDREEWIYMYG